MTFPLSTPKALDVRPHGEGIDVPKRADRQSRGDRLPDHPHRPAHGDQGDRAPTPADRGALFTRLADETHEIGEGASGYLDGAAIVALAKRIGAECIHPGYGFLSENADFAEACGQAGVVFVGPPPSAMRAMGLKSSAKALMQKAGVPVVPGYHGDNQSPKFLREKAYEIGYPVLIKAIAGGGGRGMRRVDAHVEFEAALESARREAEAPSATGGC